MQGERVRFSPHCCFHYDHSPEEINCLRTIANHLKGKEQVTLYGAGKFLDYFLKHCHWLNDHVTAIITNELQLSRQTIAGIPVFSINNPPKNIKIIFLCETLAVPMMYAKKKLLSVYPKSKILTLNLLTKLDPTAIPQRAFVKYTGVIYPIDLPDIEFLPHQDLILIDCPSRNLNMMPNGLAYVYNALKKTGIQFQTVDLDNIIYHRYHIHRLLDTPGKLYRKDGVEMPSNPWDTEQQAHWSEPTFVKYFQPEIDEIIGKLIKAKPKILGLSIQQNNVLFSREVVRRVKSALPGIIILVGGYSCYYPAIARHVFPEFDYIVIGEAELIVGPLVQALIKGERPKDTDGVISKFDSPDRVFRPGKQVLELDTLDMPTYDWVDDLSLYRNYNGYQLTPITGSRGCRWGKCRFCIERFFWRSHSPKSVVDEIEWFYNRGCDLFQFNESDFNGDPDNVTAICDEILKRHLKVKLTGQLRIHKKGTRVFFDKLKKAGFVSIRFGIDACAKKTLKLQNKGYTLAMITENLKNAHEAGIFVEINIVIGVPGETEADINESIQFLIEHKDYIDSVANINTLFLSPGCIYWLESEKYRIRFRGDKQKLYQQYPDYIPDKFWYSLNPFIDKTVRTRRFEKIVQALYQAGLNVGVYAQVIIKNVLKSEQAKKSEQPIKELSQQSVDKIIVCKENFYKVRTTSERDCSRLRKKKFIICEDCLNHIQLIEEGFSGYNVMEILGDFYAIKQGYLFNKFMADTAQYRRGVCFQGKNVREVKNLITVDGR